VWPPDFSAILHGHISKPDWKVPWQDVQHIVSRFCITPSFEYGLIDPLRELHELSLLYNSLADDKVPECQRRAENAVSGMVALSRGRDFIANLPLGIAAPLCEATRTCQLAPPTGWSQEAYQLVGRNDLAASMTNTQDVFVARGYKRRKEFIVRYQFLVTKSLLKSRYRVLLNVARKLAKSLLKRVHWPRMVKLLLSVWIPTSKSSLIFVSAWIVDLTR
jgi:hypothetical protein